MNVFVGLGDVNSFGPWYRKSPYRNRLSYIRKMRTEFKRFEKKTGYFFKNNGDGFLVIQPAGRSRKKEGEQFMRNLCCIHERMVIMNRNHLSPRPEGFRIIGGYGEVNFESNPDDYYGDIINTLAKILMFINRSNTVLIHEPFCELLMTGPRIDDFRYGKIIKPKWRPPWLDDRDVETRSFTLID